MEVQKRNIDLIIENAWILCLDDKFTEHKDACILVDKGVIVSICQMDTKPDWNYHERLDASDMIVIPPFFNAHCHAPMSLLRGLGNDVPLNTWLEKFIWPAEAKYINRKSVYLGSLLSGIEMIHSGTNIFADMYFFEEEVARAALDLGMRAILGEGILDFPTPNSKKPGDAFLYNEGLISKFSSEKLISMSIPAHSPYTCSEKTLQQVSAFSQKHNIPSTIHLSETRQEVEESFSKHGKSPVKHLFDIGFFDSDSVCYHCVHLSEDDLNILYKNNVSVVSLPNSNAKLGSGIAPIKELLSSNINVALGTDGAASNNNLSMLNELQLLTKLQKVVHKDPTVITAKEALAISTLNGAKAYSLENELGSLEVGKQADMVLIDTRSPNMTPLYDPYAQIVYSMHNKDVHSMIINGKLVLSDHEIIGVNEGDIINEVKEFSNKLGID